MSDSELTTTHPDERRDLNPVQQIGATIDHGLSDWQIIQRDSGGQATLALGGRWVADATLPGVGIVQVRVVNESNGGSINSQLDWRPTDTIAAGTWSTTLEIPAGGLYRVETRYVPPGMAAHEWAPRGDMRHFIGVGDLWVIAGQSNSAGYGRGAIEDPPVLGVHLLGNNERWALAAHPLNESTDTRHPVNREPGNPGHAPYLQFARTLQRVLGYPIGLVQAALGGCPLSVWNPTEPGPAPLFENMLHCVRLAGGRVRGILWYQGESDRDTEEQAASYADRFCASVTAWRTALDDVDLPVITVQLNRVCEPTPDADGRRWSIVRDAQRRVPSMIEGVLVVPALDLPLSDPIHTSPAGNLILGERMALAALGDVYGRSVSYRAPMIETARREADQTIVLEFADVTSRLETIDFTAHPFRVEDDNGLVEVETVVYPGDSTIRLLLRRPLMGRAVVHAAYGQSPPPLPLDMARLLPMLAFWDVPVL